jgi:SsrA-binding protein
VIVKRGDVKKDGEKRHVKVVCRNPFASRDYVLEERLEAGISLTGSEVKSLRDGGSSLKDAYVAVEGGEAWLVNAHIAPYRSASIFNHEPRRRRRLLLHKRQILRLGGRISQEGMTVVPLELFFLNGRAKVMIAAGKGRKFHDRREVIRKKEERREMERAAGAGRRRG